MKTFSRIELNSNIMGGKPCIKGTRVTVGTIVGLIASGASFDNILQDYPYLKNEDITESLEYAAWRTSEVEVELESA
ncbi:MAG: hypothetical protein A2X61_01300 [Ignavibacteria bacterium GWB2_35_12]|nr:MAG: hypothetical protein A2X63_13620 [Ignavibacteria bacterium GWA2_35_8]OGU42054.1 MAG: hypothetical protein A2X61_01300 [Ignavibacteria bacterium GWB2_35_12]OGV18737.1 MAG: hypothetical protein A2475_08870 [Ignavibacteria bacterium RIFOXYC2_FULL_35_21]